jgi:hypothetical protein
MHGQNEKKAKTPLTEYTPEPWNLYDRALSVELKDVNGEKGKKELFKGIVIGRRQIMGIKDTYLIPLLTSLVVIALGFSFLNMFLKRDENGQIVGLNGWFIALEAVFLALGIFLAVYLIRRAVRCKKFNAEEGMSAVYLDPEKKRVAFRDITGADLILDMDSIVSYFRLSGFELTIAGIGIKIYSRLFVQYKGSDGKKKWKIVHYLENPEETISWMDLVQHEYRGKEE